MDHPEIQPDHDLRSLFKSTTPEVAPINIEAIFAQADHSRSLMTRIPNRRMVMMIRIAAGTLIAVGAAAVVALFVPRETVAALQLADVERQVTTTRSVTFHQTGVMNGKAQESMKMLVLGSNLIRAEFADGYSISDFQAKKSMIVDSKRKNVRLLEGTAYHSYEQKSFYDLIKDMAKNPTKILPEREIGGKWAVGFVVLHLGHETTVWADPQTKLPVRIEQSAKEGADTVEQIMSDIVFDRRLDESLFAMTPPEGFKVETFGVTQLAPEAKDPSIAAPLVTPLVGIGPAKFGMTKEEVIQALGKPDRENPQGRITYLSYYSRGFELCIVPPISPTKYGLFSVTCLNQHGFMVKVREFQGKTDRGIGLGATRDEIIKAYGPPDGETTSRLKDVFGPKTANPEKLTGQTGLSYYKLNLSFALFEGKTYQIMINAPRLKPAPKP